MKFIGITGSIGSGKSTAAKILKNFSCVIIDADKIAKEVVKPGSSTWKKLAAAYHQRFFTSSGELNRMMIAREILPNKSLTDKLNRIIHPAVFECSFTKIKRAAESDPNVVIVYDIPLLFETKMHKLFQLTIFIKTSAKIVNVRLAKVKNLSSEYIDLFRKNQLPPEIKMQQADIVIANDGTSAEFKKNILGTLPRIYSLPNLDFKVNLGPKLDNFLRSNYSG